MDKKRLYDIIFKIKECIELNESYEDEIQLLKSYKNIPDEDLRVLFEGGEIDYIVDHILLFDLDTKDKDKKELIAIVSNIIDGTDSEAQMSEWIRILEQNVPYPDCIIDILDDENYEYLSPEELLQKILDYKPNIIHL